MTAEEKLDQILKRLDAIEKALKDLRPKDNWMDRLDPRKPYPETNTAPPAGGKPDF